MSPDPTPQPGLRNVVGVPVHGPDFFDRERERELVWQRLRTNHVLLPSPRRVGKTSLMRCLAREAGDHSFTAAVYADVAGASDEREFIAKLAGALTDIPAAAPIVRQLRKGPLARLFARISSISVKAVGVGLRDEREKTWRELGDEWIRAMRGHGGRWLILCDELGIFVQTLLRRERGDTARARAFLTWLRDDVRQGGTPAEQERLRWLVASSIGLPTLTDLNRIGDTINDFQLVPVGPFDDPIADLFLVELARGRGIELEPAVRQRILQKVGWPIPYFLQVFFAALTERVREAVTTDHVDATFEDLLGLEYRTYFDWWSQRLVEELGRQHAHYARIALTACAQRAEGMRADTLQTLVEGSIANPDDLEWVRDRLFDTLESDGYWVLDGERYRFRSNLLREYWLRRHGR